MFIIVNCSSITCRYIKKLPVISIDQLLFSLINNPGYHIIAVFPKCLWYFGVCYPQKAPLCRLKLEKVGSWNFHFPLYEKINPCLCKFPGQSFFFWSYNHDVMILLNHYSIIINVNVITIIIVNVIAIYFRTYCTTKVILRFLKVTN